MERRGPIAHQVICFFCLAPMVDAKDRMHIHKAFKATESCFKCLNVGIEPIPWIELGENDDDL
jgi:hypothetical protein